MALWAKYQWAQWARKVFDITEHAWQLQIDSLDSPSVKLATYKLSQRGEPL